MSKTQTNETKVYTIFKIKKINIQKFVISLYIIDDAAISILRSDSSSGPQLENIPWWGKNILRGRDILNIGSYAPTLIQT